MTEEEQKELFRSLHEMTEEQQKELFRSLHEKWDKKVGKALLDEIQECKGLELFKNPYELEVKFIEWIFKNVQANAKYGESKEELETEYSPEEILDRIARTTIYRDSRHADWHEDVPSNHIKEAFESVKTATAVAEHLANYVSNYILTHRYDAEKDVLVGTEDTVEGLTANEINRLKQTLGQGNDKYYVYMLIVEGEGKPFYIGKGQGDRVFTHEIDAKSIEEGRDDAEADYTKLSDKIKTILDNKGHINKVIIKWGLTSEEAFMCESALINMYDYLCKYPSTIQLSKNDMLSNIVNGHASKKEKSSKSIGEFKTQAWEVKDFLNNVAIQGKYFPREIQKRCLFININEAMDWWYRKYSNESINRDDYIKDSVRCFWKLRQFTEKDMPEYVIALYQQVVIGVFEVKKCFNLTDKQAFPKYSPYHRMNDWCVYESHKKNGKPNYGLYVEIFKKEFKKKYELDYDTYIKNPKKKKNLFIDNYGQKHVIDTNDMFNKTEYTKILKRIGFELQPSTAPMMNDLKGCLLADSFLKNQNCRYNFDKKGKVNYDKWGIGQVEIEYTPKYNSYTWLGTLHMEIAGNGTFSWKNGFMGRWKLTKQQEKDYCAFFSNPQNLEDFFDDNKAYSTDLDRTNISHPTSYELQITWNGHVKKVSVGVPDIPFKHPFN